MTLKLYAYAMAGVCILAAFYFIEKGHFKYGFWIIVISLTVFVGGAINIDKIINVSGELKILNNEVKGLETKVQQVLNLKQEISQTVSNTVNVVTEVKKEIANIQETIQQFYKHLKVERFYLYDTENVWINSTGKGSEITFRLEYVPIEHSLSIVKIKGGSTTGIVSSVPEYAYDNTITFHTDEEINSLFAPLDEEYMVTYFPDMSKNPTTEKYKVSIGTIKKVETPTTNDNKKEDATDKPKKQNK